MLSYVDTGPVAVSSSGPGRYVLSADQSLPVRRTETGNGPDEVF